MPRKGFTLRVPAIGVLSEGEIESIHCGALKTLEETGVRMDSAWALSFLAKHGCQRGRAKTIGCVFRPSWCWNVWRWHHAHSPFVLQMRLTIC